MISQSPFVFARSFDQDGVSDQVVVAIGPLSAPATLPVGGVFADGTELRDRYTGDLVTVDSGQVILNTPGRVALLETVSN